MRDPARIDTIIKKLEKAWYLFPDWRLGQLVSNLQGAGQHDVFHPEDDEWENWLDSFLEEPQQ